MSVSEKGTKRYYPRHASADGSRLDFKRQSHEMERERERESQSLRERAEKTKRKEGEMRSEATLGLALF
jgi:hypothetical protein